MRCTESDSKSEVHSDTGLPQETRKVPHKANLSPKTIRKNRIDKAQSQHKEENNKDCKGNKIEI